MYLLYADESGNTGLDLDNPNQPIFVISGIAVKDSDWYDLNYMFQKRKVEICDQLNNVEIHTTDIFSSSKSIRKGFDFRKYSLEENLHILEQLVDFIVENNFPIFLSIIKKNYFKNFCEANFKDEEIDPYLYGFAQLSNAYNDFLIHNKSNGMIFLDEIREKIKDINFIFDKLLLTNFECDTSNVIENVVFLNSQKNNFIQLADLCAFYINKYITLILNPNVEVIKNPIKKEHCLAMYNKLRPLFVFSNNEKIEKFFINIKNEQGA